MNDLWRRFFGMLLDAIQTLVQFAWGFAMAAVSGAVPALAGAGYSQAKYGQTYWQDMIPVAIAGALVGVGGFLAHRQQIQTALMTPPPGVAPGPDAGR